jgi:hypothetical protein
VALTPIGRTPHRSGGSAQETPPVALGDHATAAGFDDQVASAAGLSPCVGERVGHPVFVGAGQVQAAADVSQGWPRRPSRPRMRCLRSRAARRQQATQPRTRLQRHRLRMRPRRSSRTTSGRAHARGRRSARTASCCRSRRPTRRRRPPTPGSAPGSLFEVITLILLTGSIPSCFAVQGMDQGPGCR